MNDRPADIEKAKKDKAKQAVSLAMKSRWDDAVAVNRSILESFPDDLEAYNRLGKALSEMGRNREAMESFRKALKLSPHNSIAKKNLGRLSRLGDESPRDIIAPAASSHSFIEEGGKAGVTSLVNLASPESLINLAPGHRLQIRIEGNVLKVSESSGKYVGQVEPRLATRLTRLIKGGNAYEGAVTSVTEGDLTIIIRESFKHPSQADIVSFPLRGGADYRVYMPSTLLGGELNEESPADDTERVAVKDWSDDDTEPGDDDAFTPVLHRIINPTDESDDPEDAF